MPSLRFFFAQVIEKINPIEVEILFVKDCFVPYKEDKNKKIEMESGTGESD